MSEMVPLSAEQAAVKEKMLRWLDVTKELVFNKHTCEQGWTDFSPSSSEGCADYHAAFPLLDLMGLCSSPRGHEEFYDSSIRAATTGKESPRVLISGLATPLMADIVLAAANPLTRIDVLDICATPLATCKRVFKPEQVKRMEFIQTDVLRFKGQPGVYDAIVTDAFLTRFKYEDRLKVLKDWAGMLKPDGRVVTTWRIGERTGEKGYGDEQDKEIFMKNVEQRVKLWGVPMRNFSEMDTIFSLARKYAEKMHSYSGQTEEEIKIFMEQGFGDVRMEISPNVYDVTMRKYVRIIAYKPKK